MNSLNIPLNSRYHYEEIPQIERDFLKSSQVRDFQEINMKLQISEDSELGGHKFGEFTVCTSLAIFSFEPPLKTLTAMSIPCN